MIAIAIRHVRTLILLLLAVIGGCVSHGPEALVETPARPGARTVTVFVATIRAGGETDAPFAAGRRQALGFARYVVSVPPTHRPGDIEWSDGRIDSATDFAVVEKQNLSGAAFLAAVARSSPPGEQGLVGGTGIFVHGYNTSFAEGLFRVAQLAADTDLALTPVLFAWPSQVAFNGYLADRNSAVYSRDYLVELLVELDRAPGAGRTAIEAHSLGAWLTVEAIRQLELSGRHGVVRRMGQVVLAAPDIEVGVFRQQMRKVGPMDPPMIVLVAKHDRALAASRRLSGGRPILGAADVTDPAIQALAHETGVRIVDISALPARSFLRHDRFVALATLDADLTGDGGRYLASDVGQAGAFVLGTIGDTLSAPFLWAADTISR